MQPEDRVERRQHRRHIPTHKSMNVIVWRGFEPPVVGFLSLHGGLATGKGFEISDAEDAAEIVSAVKHLSSDKHGIGGLVGADPPSAIHKRIAGSPKRRGQARR